MDKQAKQTNMNDVGFFYENAEAELQQGTVVREQPLWWSGEEWRG